MNDSDFKNTLIKALELDKKITSGKKEIILALSKSNMYIEYSGLFTYKEWNTYCAIFAYSSSRGQIQLIKSKEEMIFDVAKIIFGKQEDYYLTGIETGIILSSHKVVNFSKLFLTDVIKKRT